MTKNIVIGLLALTTLFLFMYAFVQKAEADKQWKHAEAQRHLADSLARAYEQQRAIAAEQAQLLLLQKELMESQKK